MNKIFLKITFLSFPIFIAFQCSENKYHEEIIERYPNGAKKLLVKYQG